MFSAGASHYGVADCELLAQETHKFESRYLDNLIGPYPAAKATYIERSPIHSVDKFSAPIIFFQASHIEQSAYLQASSSLPCCSFSCAQESTVSLPV